MKLLKAASTINSQPPPLELAFALFNRLLIYVLQLLLPLVVHFVLVGRQSDQCHARLFVFRVGHHLLDIVGLHHLAVLVINTLLVLLLLFIEHPVAMALPDLLELGVFTLNIVKGIPNARL